MKMYYKHKYNFFKISALLIVLFAFHPLKIKSQDKCNTYSSVNNRDIIYRVSFDDSGVGGLIFLLDVLQELEPQLKELESKYSVKFVFQHVGDSKNAPYGSRTPAEIKNLVRNFLNYTVKLPQTKSLVIACNTASTVYDSVMNAQYKVEYPDLNIISMIQVSSKEIVEIASKKSTSKNELHIALLATPATLKSAAYQTQILNYSKTNNKQLNLYTYAPITWVSNLENGVDKSKIDTDLNADLEAFKIKMGDNFQKISVAGLFCTHYPYYKKEIKQFFEKNGNKNVEILTQGQVFSDDIFLDIISHIQNDSIEYPKRKNSMPINCVNQIEIDSNITGNNIVEMRNTIHKTHPQYSDKVEFRIVSF